MLSHYILSIMHGLSNALQETNVNSLNINNEMLTVRKLLLEIQTLDILESATELCTTVNITLGYEEPVGISRQDSTECASPHEFCEHLKAATVPLLVLKLERRFSDENIDILGALEGLDPSKSTYLDYAIFIQTR